ncbi:iron-sulfur cluster biosynthesis family protein [Bacillus gobiensis]|uniref:iron-sulfur cluster biosynthesis family protein n=1 Tax=Bacillus gobiensis TaxID=1441095 RepID=UPI003D22ABA8
MVITLTETAMDKLQAIELKEEQFLRIDADIAGGCGLSVKFAIVLDKPRCNDTVIEYDGIQFRMDRFTKRYLDEEVQIDYTDERGFLIGEILTSSACAGGK